VLPAGTLLYVRGVSKDSDVLVARDLTSGSERVVTDLTGDGSRGWNISGFSLSPDRRRIAIASLYGPTKEDTATGLATRAIWTLTTEGRDFRRLTPTVPNASSGRSGYNVSVGNPIWNATGSHILFDFGTYWYKGTRLEGGSVPWIVPASAAEPPTIWPAPLGCSILYPSRNPVTGEMLLIHSVCVPPAKDGLYLYPAEGSTAPKQLLAASHASGGISIFLTAPSWLPDGSGFLFVGWSEATDANPSLFAYDMGTGKAAPVLVPPAKQHVYATAVAPDGSKIVYCLRDDTDGHRDLHLVDLTVSPPTDTPLTTDGASCSPAF